MSITKLLKSILLWVGIIPLAMLNGIGRELFLELKLSESAAMMISGILLAIFIFVYTFFTIRFVGQGRKKDFVIIGVCWFILTVLFETLLGITLGYTFEELIKAYDFTSGNLWLFVLIFASCTPFLTAHLKNLIN